MADIMVKHSIESCMLHEAGKEDPCRVVEIEENEYESGSSGRFI